ncbi:MAG: hypothetical protein CL912_31425 [Deltaproteobacteria bacterium]|nr:hypothetical protein [Deltaproteobacteria bacterium]
MDELELQNTWNLVELPPNRTYLRGRWVYKIKTDLDNNIIKYKSRWVVKGFDQILGLDYLETFSATCRPESYRLIFILAMSNKWKLLQYDVKNAFVHANIDADIYVEQPIGLEKYYNKNSKQPDGKPACGNRNRRIKQDACISRAPLWQGIKISHLLLLAFSFLLSFLIT